MVNVVLRRKKRSKRKRSQQKEALGFFLRDKYIPEEGEGKERSS